MPESRLERRIGIVGAITIVVSNMIGTGIFTTTGFLAGDLGSPRLVISIWLVGGLIALCGAISYVELAINFPRSGGEYVYLSEAWGPAWGFIDGWVSLFAGFSAPLAAAALAISAYLGLSDEGRALGAGPLTIHLGDAQLFACAVILVFTVLNLFGVLAVARLQTALTALKLAVVGAFLVLGFSIGNGDIAHFAVPAVRTSEEPLFAQFAVSLVFVFFAYSGWNAAVYVAEEVREPNRTFPVALISGTVLVIILYLGLNLLYVYGGPLERLKGVVAVGAQVASGLFGEGMARAFSIAMAASLLATVNAMCLVGPRVYYAMAQNRAFFPVATRLHPKWKSPFVAVSIQGAVTLALILLPTFRGLALYIGFTLYLFTALSVLALFKFRKRPGWKRFRWLDRTYPLIPLLYVGMSLWVLVFTIRGAPESSLAAIATVVAGALLYQRYRGQPSAG
ncbi:MAG TPA: amino acid permease [Vicinamibacteria bacterium]|nr:amino acid permease [Vicinamibacteria bacterium]